MLTDGITLLGTSNAVNLAIDSGADFPAEASAGELFFKIGVGLHSFDGTDWVVVGGGGEVAFADITDKPTTLAGYGITDTPAPSGISSIFATFGGAVGPQTGINRYYPSRTIDINKLNLWVSTVGAGNVSAAVRKNGTIIGTITLNAGAFRTSVPVSPTVQVTENDYLTIDITSGTATDLTVRIDF